MKIISFVIYLSLALCALAEVQEKRIDLRDYNGDTRAFIRAVLDETEPGWSNGQSGIYLVNSEINAINKWTMGVAVGGQRTLPIAGGKATMYVPQRDYYYMIVTRQVEDASAAGASNPQVNAAAQPCTYCGGKGYFINSEGKVDPKTHILTTTRQWKEACPYCNGTGVQSN